MDGQATVICDTQTTLGAGGVFLSDPIQYEGGTVGRNQDGYVAVIGFVNSDQNCTVDIYQGTIAEINANVTNVAPAAGVSDGSMNLTTFNFVGAANSPGAPFLALCVSQAVRIRVTNTGGAQAKFNLHAHTVQ